ncbi:MAG: hypothetical protein AAGE52_18805 [Myxococcota bacterium]
MRFLVAFGLVLGCGASSTPTPSSSPESVLACDEVEVLARTDRPDNVRREILYLESDYQSAPGAPTSHVHVRVRPGANPTLLATRVGASVRSVEGWHLFVFDSPEAAKRGVRDVLCDPHVAEASVSLQPHLR